ncbi:MAG TPA: class II aldolase/adducin family protein [Ktedonobacteraceae bacterium]|nr:class II aldolase/adducin family protein [Ktedonobacteraceae bacterium]
MAHDSTMVLREQLVEAVQRLLLAGVMSHSKHGNMSARLPGTEQLLLTSTGLQSSLSPEHLPIVTFDGEVVSGTLDPTTREIIGMHAAVYRARPDVNSVMHTHSPHVTSFALAHQPLPCAYEALLRFGITVDIPVADWAPRGSRESVTNILDQLRQHPDAPAVLLANHGLLAFGPDALMTAFLIISMEEAAEMTLQARKLGGEQGFPAGALEKEREHMRQFGSLR